jgi:hypothetical protein
MKATRTFETRPQANEALKAAADEIGAALGHFSAENKKPDGSSYGTSITVIALDGKWNVYFSPKLRKDRSAHERIAYAEALEKATAAALTMVTTLPTEACERIKLALSFDAGGYLRIEGQTLRGPVPAIRIKRLATTLPVAAKLLAAEADSFRQPRTFRMNGRRVSLREMSPEAGKPAFHHAFPMEVECDAETEEAIRNAFAHAAFISTLRSGATASGNFKIEKIETILSDATGKTRSVLEKTPPEFAKLAIDEKPNGKNP